jgi:hypothetical protein
MTGRSNRTVLASSLLTSTREVATARRARNGRRTLVKYPDRFEAAHMRHEDVDDHQIEGRILKSDETGRAAVSDRDLEATSVEPRLYRKADVQVIVDNQSPTHMEVPQPEKGHRNFLQLRDFSHFVTGMRCDHGTIEGPR